ncbi:MAG: AMP-binding protein, partial [Actinomycetes bacterium]
MTYTLPGLLSAGAQNAGAAALLAPDGTVTTYGDLERDVAQWASGFRGLGIERGDRVLYQVEKSPAVVALHLALLRCGAIQVPVNTAYSDTEVSSLLSDAEPAMVIRDPTRTTLPGTWQSLTLNAAGEGSARGLSTDADVDLPFVHGDDGAALLYTSGTTGRPKGALLTHANLVHNAEVLVAEWGFTQSDVLLHMLPL